MVLNKESYRLLMLSGRGNPSFLLQGPISPTVRAACALLVTAKIALSMSRFLKASSIGPETD
jgi:hypothetical protein